MAAVDDLGAIVFITCDTANPAAVAVVFVADDVAVVITVLNGGIGQISDNTAEVTVALDLLAFMRAFFYQAFVVRLADDTADIFARTVDGGGRGTAAHLGALLHKADDAADIAAAVYKTGYRRQTLPRLSHPAASGF